MDATAAGPKAGAGPKKHTQAEKVVCSFCQEPADLNLSLEHRECGGRTHVECLPSGKKPNYKLCSQCTGEYVPLAQVASMDTAPAAGGGGREPFPPDGVDYVRNPGVWIQKTPASALQAITGLFSRTPAAAADAAPPTVEQLRTSQDCHFLIRNRVSVRDMLRFNKLGLQHLLKAGVTMSELLANDYTWNDLLLYEDVGRKGPTRAKQTLAQGLKTNANHFRDYPDALPFAKVSSHANLKPSDLYTDFGLKFPVITDEVTGQVRYGSLQCHGDERWTARDCVALGLSMPDLMAAGLCLLQQYEDLLIGLSQPEAIMAEKQLQVQEEHMNALLDLNAPQALAPAPVRAPAVEPNVVVVRSAQAPPTQEVDLIEEEQEPQEVQYYPVGAPTVVPYQVPVPAVRPVVVTKPKVLAAPIFKTPVNRYDRHGAILAPVRRTK